MSIQARDGASRDTLLAVADCAMAAWDKLTGNLAMTDDFPAWAMPDCPG